MNMRGITMLQARTMTINARPCLPLLMLAAMFVMAACQGPGSTASGSHDGHDHSKDSHDDHGHGEEGHEEGAVALTGEQAAIAGIETIQVSLGEAQSGLVVPGTISAVTSRRALVTPASGGRLVSLSAVLGQKVVKGQILGVIESTDLAEAYGRVSEAKRQQESARAQLRDLESQVKLAEARTATAAQTLSRQKQFVQAGAFNQAPLQAAQSELNDAQSDLLSAQKEQASHAEALRRTEALYKDGLVSRLDLDAARLEMQQDEIKVSRAKSRVDLAQAAKQREKRIADQGLLNSREVQTAEADHKAATLELERTRIALRSGRESLRSAEKSVANASAAYRAYAGGAPANGGRVSLAAPLSGVVTHIDVTIGQAVDRTQSLFEIEDLSQVWATAQIPEKSVQLAAKGMKARITASALPDKVFVGSVQVVSSRIDPKTRTLALQCLVPNPNLELKPEMFVSVNLAAGPVVRGISIPKESVFEDEGRSWVFIKKEGEYHLQEVVVGEAAGSQVSIQKGLESGQVLVVKGAFILKSQLKKDDLKGHEH